MSYKRKAIKINDIPKSEAKKKSMGRVWADAIIDDFWASDDEAWEILEDQYNRPLNPETVNKCSVILRNAAKCKSKEFEGQVKVKQSKNRLFIYGVDD